MKHSIRLRLLAGTLAIVAIIWAAMTLFAWRETRHEADELFDAHLVQTAALLAATIGDETDDIAEHLPQHRYARQVAFQVWGDNGEPLARSATAPHEPLAPLATGFADTSHWRVFGIHGEDAHHLILVAESREARASVSRELATHMLAPLAIALPALALGLAILIGVTLAPLSALAKSIGRRSPEHLDPIAVNSAPRELHPILVQLNRLLDRVARSLQRERNFTGDAAHELRTPLAAMRAHAQVARASHDEAERTQAIDNVIAAIDRTTHLTEQLLVLTRLDAASRITKTLHDLRALAADVVATTAPGAIAKQIELELQDGPPIAAEIEPALVATLLRNLIDNAIRYSPMQTTITLSVACHDGNARIEVVDQGPGIASDELARVRDRFYRIAGNDEPGSGLGLSIASRIAELHGGKLDLENADAGGLRAIVTLPLPATAA